MNESIENIDPLEYIRSLKRHEAINILIRLYKDGELSERIMAKVKESLSAVDVESVANEVFSSLNSIDIDDLWENSGSTQWGYQEPSEVAFDMMGVEIAPHIKKMEQYGKLGMEEEEKVYCKGIISGILKYAAEGSNEFHDAVPDDPYIHAENIIYDWKKHSSEEDIAEAQAVYDSFFADDTEGDDSDGN
jgi:hypothetical protein